MKFNAFKTTLPLVLAAAACTAHAGNLYVVCNANVTLQAAEMRDVFLGDKQFAGTVKLQLADNAAAQAEFLEKVMKMDASKYSTSWTKKSFRDGLSMPPVKGTDAEALDCAKRTPGACTYSTTAPGAGLTVIVKF